MRINHIEYRIEEQTSHARIIASALENLVSVGEDNISIHRLDPRKAALEEAWLKFSTNHDAINIAMRQVEIQEKLQLLEHPYFTEHRFTTIHESYLEALENMNSLRARLKPEEIRAPSVQSEAQASNYQATFGPRLPYLDLPKFNGSPSEWLQFKDMFQSMVIFNPSLSPVWKLHYLKNSLKGTAAHLLKNTALTADNFQKAWDSLIEFYENKRLLVNSALQSLLTIKRMTKESAAEMESLYTTITQIYRTLETLGRPVDMWDDFLVFIAVQRLDADSIKAWEQHLGSSKDPPTWQQFIQFLMTRVLTLQAVEKSRKPSTQAGQQSVKAHHASSGKCILCSEDHYIFRCPQYVNQSIERRLEAIKQNKLCFNCLGQHRIASCKSTKRCIKCGKKHHTTIHKSNHSDKQSTSTPQPAARANCASVNQATAARTLLATVQIIVSSETGEQAKVRALIDPGSQISFISERVVQRLRLPKHGRSLPLQGIGATRAGRTRGVVSVKLSPHFESSVQCVLEAHILPKLTSKIPAVNTLHVNWPHIRGLRLADPDFQLSGQIDLIIGADYYGQVIEEGLRRGSTSAPTAQATIFGWVLLGPSQASSSPTEAKTFQVSIDEELYELLQKFWTLDELPSSSRKSLSTEEQKCEDHFRGTHSRDENGRYVVKLPFKQSSEQLGDSKAAALRMLSRLSNKLTADPPLQKAYSAFLAEYEALQHMNRVAASSSEPRQVYYLPHHGISRPGSVTTKLRVVFNASSRTTTGVSLNDILHTGAKLQTELIDVLIQFRQFKYVFMSDIEKMYRQIKVHPDDWDFQRILWSTPSHEIRTYQLTTVTYGLACAPFLALRVMQQIVEDEGSKFPLAVPILSKGRYVDDLFGGANTTDDAEKAIHQVNELCMAGGFPLQKWTSNDATILEGLPPEKLLFSASIPIEHNTIVHALGMLWNPTSDTFHFTWTIPSVKAITKRTILSTIARFFDPLGLLSPLIVNAKIFIQELWTIKLDWDDPLPTQVSERWTSLVQRFKDLHGLSFPRWLRLSVPDSQAVEIHGFSDASQQALAAAVYVRTTDAEGEVQTALVCSKTKVAPLKRLTIPRLELSAAVLLTKLVDHLTRVLGLEKVPVHLWTDSTITYTWINSHPSRWKEFVHNRVCLIQEMIPAAKWRVTPGKENPADCATRGLTPSQLSQHEIWWSGPDWLRSSQASWPNHLEAPSIDDNLEERPIQATTTIAQPPKSSWNLIDKYSSLTKLLRVTAICKRFLLRLRKMADSISQTPLSTHEVEEAKQFWVRVTQSNFFGKELKQLCKGESLPSSHHLARLTPFIDSAGLIRLGGRLQSSLLPANAKHPFILPRESQFTQLVMSDAHHRTLHGGTQDTLSFIRNTYWIIGGRVPVSSFIGKCIKCARHRQQRAQQLMGQLPSHRVTPSRPFLHSGVDYAGPLQLKTWKGRAARKYKAYIALFVCQSTSAIHLEVVTDYTADAFIAAYKRFTARRGICATLRSDCGTNLKGADSELQALFSSSSKELGELSAILTNDGTQWLFNPPAAPHFGGKWEAGVKSVKFHLRRVIGDHLLTYEEMTTVLTQIEAVLNSRPLCALTEDPDDLNVLTPGHFLIGGPLAVVPEPSLEAERINRLSRWQLLRQMLDSFWTKWSKECLQRYQTIYKWNQPSSNIQKGSLVLVIDERYPPSKWPLGRIIDVHPGKDGHTRVVTVRTQTSVLKRPITKISPLPIETDTL